MQTLGKRDEIDASVKGFYLDLKNRGGRYEVLSRYNHAERD